MSDASSPSRVLLDRRRFCTMMGTSSLAVAAVGGIGVTAEYLTPNVLMEPSLVFEAGAPEEFAPDSVTMFPNKKAFVIRTAGGAFYALSAVCTHLGCIVNWKSDENVIACPCHGSRFNTEGEVLAGPAPRSLVRIHISLTDKNRLVVDPGAAVSPDTYLRV